MSTQVLALNDPAAVENRIHSDDIAQRLGFTGALVPGVTVYGLLARLPVHQFGDAWFQHSQSSVRFLKPAYHGDLLDLSMAPATGPEATADSWQAEIRSATDTLLAPLTVAVGEDNLPPVDPRWQQPPASANPARNEISWDDLQPGQALARQWFRPTLTDNAACAWLTADPDPRYASTPGALQPVVHPLLIARWWNKAFTLRWQMPVWIHVGTEFSQRGAIHVGELVELRTVIDERWEHKGHQFARLYLALVVAGELRHEALHTAIIRPAGL